jgi:hypothetical protein
MLIWLTFQIKPGFCDCLIENANGDSLRLERMAKAKADRQLRRQLADDFATDLKAVKDAGWK